MLLNEITIYELWYYVRIRLSYESYVVVVMNVPILLSFSRLTTPVLYSLDDVFAN